MGMPGEIPQEIGRAYKKILLGCLEVSVEGFRRLFEVETAPNKVGFQAPSGTSFSFDVLGTLKRPPYNCEVMIESKGYKDGSKLLEPYRDFLAMSYVTWMHFQQHKGDLFWFVTNVPFGSTFGTELTSPRFMLDSFTKHRTDKVDAILGTASIDLEETRSLSEHIGVCILTDSFIRASGISYVVEQDENLWYIVEFLHGKRIPKPYYRPIVDEIVSLNKRTLKDPNLIFPGQRLVVPWYGIE